MHNIHFLIGGFFVGSLLSAIISNIVIKRACGTLRIDRTNPEKDIYRFDIDNLDALSKKKRVTLRVDNDADLSQK